MKIYRMQTDNWHLDRFIYLIAGIFIFGSVILALTISTNFIYFTGLVGFMLISFALSGYCPMAIFLDKLNIKSKIIK